MLLSRAAAHLRLISSSRPRSIRHSPPARSSGSSSTSSLCCKAQPTQAKQHQPQPGYDLSWSDGRAGTSAEQSLFDQAHPLPAEPLDAQAALDLLAKAASSSTRPSAAWLQHVCAGSLRSNALPQLTPEQLCSLLSSIEQLGANFDPSNQWAAHLLDALTAKMPALSTRQLSAALWSVSNLELGQGEPAKRCQAAALDAAKAALQEFYSPDFAALLCALGSLGAQPPAEWMAAALAEAEYQLVECPSDFSAFDVARLASGVADLLNNSDSSDASSSSTGSDGLAAQEEPLQLSERAREALMKLVYARVRTMAEKGAVDFALSKLDSRGKHSMHFDPRWTHEELHWLPRRERDKRRMIKEGWERSQWGGFG